MNMAEGIAAFRKAGLVMLLMTVLLTAMLEQGDAIDASFDPTPPVYEAPSSSGDVLVLIWDTIGFVFGDLFIGAIEFWAEVITLAGWAGPVVAIPPLLGFIFILVVLFSAARAVGALIPFT